ncbi:MAG: hypothetical protein ACJ76F_04540 [Bacteroidia bacterium]
MKGSDDLFRLIHSLDKNEKRYFKLSVAKYETAADSNYLRLFDAMDSLEEYDEEKLKKKFRGQKLQKNFPSEKNYLHRLILRTLRTYSPEENVENRIKDMLREAEFLYRKALYDQCHKILVKARDLALTHQKHLLQAEIISMEGQLMILLNDKELFDDYLMNRLPAAGEMLKKEINVFDYKYYHLKTFGITREFGDDTRKMETLSKLEEMMGSGLLKDEKHALSFQAKHYFYFMHLVHSRANRNYDNLLEHCMKDVELHETHPEIAAENADQYVSALSNLSLAQLELNHFEDCLATLNKMRLIKDNAQSTRIKINSVYYPRVIAVFLYSGRFEMVDTLIDEASAFIRKHKDQFGRMKIVSLYWNIAYCYFGMNNFREALKWLNKIINDTDLEKVRPDMNCFSRIFSLVVHYELGNYDLIEHLSRSATRYLDKKGFLFDLEKTTLKFLNDLTSLSNPKEKIREFKKFRLAVELAMKEWPVREQFEYFDFVSWCDSKTEEKPFAELFRRNLRKRVIESGK